MRQDNNTFKYYLSNILIKRYLMKTSKVSKKIIISAAIILLIFLSIITFTQNSDTGTIQIAKEVDSFIKKYRNEFGEFPTLSLIKSQFPEITPESGWIIFTDDKTFLQIQYPVNSENQEAIGKPKISEFTATVYAYIIEYQ